jgi:molecular chaperone GrpE
MMVRKSNKKEQELTADLQRLGADFENYRKRVEAEKAQLSELTKAATVMKLLPIIDTIERAAAHAPAELADNKWAQGIVGLVKNLEKALGELNLTRIEASPGTPFDPNLHEAVMMEDGEGEHEVIAEELRAGYKMGEAVIRPSMVKVTHQ